MVNFGLSATLEAILPAIAIEVLQPSVNAVLLLPKLKLADNCRSPT